MKRSIKKKKSRGFPAEYKGNTRFTSAEQSNSIRVMLTIQHGRRRLLDRNLNMVAGLAIIILTDLRDSSHETLALIVSLDRVLNIS